MRDGQCELQALSCNAIGKVDGGIEITLMKNGVFTTALLSFLHCIDHRRISVLQILYHMTSAAKV